MATPVSPLTDTTLLALCIYDEARGQSVRGQAAVAQVVLNRMRLRHFSDGTVRGTILRKDQFSGFWFESKMNEDGTWRYSRVCRNSADANARALKKLQAIRPTNASWAIAMSVAVSALNRSNTATNGLIDLGDAVLYYNPTVIHPAPKWATKDKLVASIGDHTFYRA